MWPGGVEEAYWQWMEIADFLSVGGPRSIRGQVNVSRKESNYFVLFLDSLLEHNKTLIWIT